MRVDLIKNHFLAKDKKEVKASEHKAPEHQSGPVNKLSFMNIPRVAFSGNIAKSPDLDKIRLNQAMANPVTINVDSRFNLKKPNPPKHLESQMYVNPQDPLVTKPELMTMATVTPFKPGPEGDRVKIVDFGKPLAKPNNRGNFIYPMETPQFDQVNTFALVNKALKMHEDSLGRKVPWGFNSDKLGVFPHAGEMMNAYYSRDERAIKLFEFERPDTGKMVKTCQSSDVVTHETGHAALDGLKPHYMENFGFGVAGYHEAFADTTAMLTALQTDSLMNRMLEATDGDLRKENIIASLAEEFGDAVNKNDYDPRNDNMQYLRNAINFFKQKPYKEMPFVDRFNDDTVLGLESHSYSRLFLGAGYDVLTGIYDKLKGAKSDRDSQKFALMQARDIFANIFTRALDFSPAGETDYKDMAIAMLKADKIDLEGKNRDVLEKVFIERNILNADDMKKFDEGMKAIPELSLPETIISEADALKFVEDNKQLLGIPAEMNLQPAEAYINNKGEKHIVFLNENPVTLEGPQFGKYQGEMINIQGSVSLTFDKSGKLIDNTVKQIDKQIKEDVLYSVSLLIKHILSQQEETGGNAELKNLKKLEMPQLLSKKSMKTGRNEIMKQPVIIDKIDPEKRGVKALGEYFAKLKKEMNKA